MLLNQLRYISLTGKFKVNYYQFPPPIGSLKIAGSYYSAYIHICIFLLAKKFSLKPMTYINIKPLPCQYLKDKQVGLI